MGAQRPPGLAMGLTVKPSTKLVAVAIASHAGAFSGVAWPSLATLAQETGLSRRTVVYSVRALELAGHLTITRLKRGKVNASNRYRIPKLTGSAKPGGGGAEVAPRGGAEVAPEPVRTLEPVIKAARAGLRCLWKQLASSVRGRLLPVPEGTERAQSQEAGYRPTTTARHGLTCR